MEFLSIIAFRRFILSDFPERSENNKVRGKNKVTSSYKSYGNTQLRAFLNLSLWDYLQMPLGEMND